MKALGVLDLLAAAGLILPAALGIAPVLVPLAAVGLVLLMAGAVIVRLRHGGAHAIVVDLTYLAAAGFVAWGRFGPDSFRGWTRCVDVDLDGRERRRGAIDVGENGHWGLLGLGLRVLPPRAMGSLSTLFLNAWWACT